MTRFFPGNAGKVTEITEITRGFQPIRHDCMMRASLGRKKHNHSLFDVTMGGRYGSETSDLVGLYLLFQLQAVGIHLGLFRDDGLGASDMNARDTEQAKKHICDIFASNDLRVSIEANSKLVDFLDVSASKKNSSGYNVK